VIVTGVEALTVLVFTVNVALIEPASTVTLVGTVAADALLESETGAPLVGAGPLRVTVPVVGEPPLTLLGFSVNEEIVGELAGAMVNVAFLVELP
jgi:hypothetical protein